MAIAFRERVLTALFDRLDEATWFSSRRRNWINNLDPAADYPALVMFDGGDEVAEGNPIENRVSMRADVVLAVMTDEHDELGPALSEARAKVIEAIGGDLTLGGLVSRVLHIATSDPDYSDQRGQPPEAVMTMTFTIDAFEGAVDPYTP